MFQTQRQRLAEEEGIRRTGWDKCAMNCVLLKTIYPNEFSTET